MQHSFAGLRGAGGGQTAKEQREARFIPARYGSARAPSAGSVVPLGEQQHQDCGGASEAHLAQAQSVNHPLVGRCETQRAIQEQSTHRLALRRDLQVARSVFSKRVVKERMIADSTPQILFDVSRDVGELQELADGHGIATQLLANTLVAVLGEQEQPHAEEDWRPQHPVAIPGELSGVTQTATLALEGLAPPAHALRHLSDEIDDEASDLGVESDKDPIHHTEAVRAATPAPARVESTKLADGVWLLGGGTHNSMLVEFKDFVAVVEAPQNEARSLAVIDEVHKLAPGKMIRYVVNTNHRMIYAGGLRTYFSQGTTVVTHELNKDYYVGILFSPFPRTLSPDRMTIFNPMYMISRRPPPIETVGGTTMMGRTAISDDERQMQIWHVQDMAYEVGESYLKIPGPSLARGNHSADMLMAYLPKEKILINADLYVPPELGAKPTPPTAGMRTLFLNMKKLEFDVAQHVSIVGQRVGSNDEFVKLVGNAQ